VRPDSHDPQPRTEPASWTAGSEGAGDPLSTFVTRADGQVVVHLRGELDMATAPALATCLERLCAAHPDTVVVDASHLDFCDSSGLNVLIAYNRRAQQDGVHVLLRGPSDALRRLLEITHLEHLVEDMDTQPIDGNGERSIRQDATEHQ
jgi:anti-sigma B factor antagonist